MLMKSLGSVSAPIAKRVFAMNSPSFAVIPLRFAHQDIHPILRRPHMDELIIPCGSWKENYENEQRKYNIQLICGIGFFVISLIAVLGSGEIDFNVLYPPPAPRSAVIKANLEESSSV